MNQKPSVVQILKSVPQGLTSDTKYPHVTTFGKRLDLLQERHGQQLVTQCQALKTSRKWKSLISIGLNWGRQWLNPQTTGHDQLVIASWVVCGMLKTGFCDGQQNDGNDRRQKANFDARRSVANS